MHFFSIKLSISKVFTFVVIVLLGVFPKSVFAQTPCSTCNLFIQDCSTCIGAPVNDDCTTLFNILYNPICQPTCFIPGTKIATPDGEKNIEAIKVGDEVTSFDNEVIQDNRVSNIYKSQRDFYFDLKAGNYEVKASAEHPFYVGSGKYTEIQYLKPGDQIFILNEHKQLEKKSVFSNNRINQKTDVYNMSVDNAHTFFANSFAVHNKGITQRVTEMCPSGTVVKWYDPPSYACTGNRYYGSLYEWKRPAGACSVERVCSDCSNGYYPNRVCCEWETTDTRVEWGYCEATCPAPSAFTLSSPADGAVLTTTSVDLQWNAATFSTSASCASEYRVYIDTANPPTTLHATVVSTSTNTPFTGVVGTTYYWRVAASNGSATTISDIRSFTIADDQIVGTVYLDTNNTCSTATPWMTGGVSVSVDGGAGNAIGNDGTYTVTATTGMSHTVAVSIPAGYACSTGSGCNSCNTSVVSPGTQNFFLSSVREAWWQTEGAGIYAGGLGGGVTVRSEIPSASYRLILAGGAGNAGALLRASGSTDLGNGSVSDDLWTTVARYRGKKMDYAYFAAQMGVLPTQASDWGADTMNKPGTTKDFHFIDPQSSTASISSPWVVASGEKYVVFVNGDLRIDANTTVDNGGFLAFIVSGDIIVDPAVTSMQGMYVATGNFETESVDTTDTIADVQLNTEGSVVAWGTFSLSRSLIGNNSITPAEKFTYRPDLLENMPDKMKTFAMNWEEVVPGTFGE